MKEKGFNSGGLCLFSTHLVDMLGWHFGEVIIKWMEITKRLTNFCYLII